MGEWEFRLRFQHTWQHGEKTAASNQYSEVFDDIREQPHLNFAGAIIRLDHSILRWQLGELTLSCQKVGAEIRIAATLSTDQPG